MPSLDRIAYLVRAKAPWLYRAAEAGGRSATVLLYGARIRRALAEGTIHGTVYGAPSMVRPLTAADTDELAQMLSSMSEEHLTFFHPHALDRDSLRSVLAAKTVLTYGMYVDGRLGGYGLLKLFPTRKAYRGRLIAPQLANRGVGKFLSRYLDWQVSLLDFQPCATIHRDNLASLNSLMAARPYKVVAELPNDFRLIMFDMDPITIEKPVLLVPDSPQASAACAGTQQAE